MLGFTAILGHGWEFLPHDCETAHCRRADVEAPYAHFQAFILEREMVAQLLVFVESAAEVFEVLLWCAALAIWLMLLPSFVREGIDNLSEKMRRLKANRQVRRDRQIR